MATSAIDCCSPVANSTSSSRSLGSCRKVLGHLDQAVGDAGHGGDDRDHLVAFVAGAFDACGNVADAIEGADRGAAVFLNDEGHGWSGAQ